MKRSILTALALGAAAIGSSASAATTAFVTVQSQPGYVVREEPQYYGPPRYYGPPGYAYESHEYEHRHDWRADCNAQRWDPNARYMPGQAVRHNGRVYVATETSRHVYNVNSPPEWTPNYWAPARCR